MITYHDGNLLFSGCKIICHQVNLQGIMGGGLALQIAQRYPECERRYGEYVRMVGSSNILRGTVYWYTYKGESNQIIANCFTQEPNFDTNYEAILKAFEEVKEIAEYFDYTVGIPYGYGCGIANGEWKKVLKIIKEVFEKSDVECQIWRLKQSWSGGR